MKNCVRCSTVGSSVCSEMDLQMLQCMHCDILVDMDVHIKSMSIMERMVGELLILKDGFS